MPTGTDNNPRPHLIERLENLLAALDEADVAISERDEQGEYQDAMNRVDDARGIAGEVLTMIDGR